MQKRKSHQSHSVKFFQAFIDKMPTVRYISNRDYIQKSLDSRVARYSQAKEQSHRTEFDELNVSMKFEKDDTSKRNSLDCSFLY